MGLKQTPIKLTEALSAVLASGIKINARSLGVSFGHIGKSFFWFVCQAGLTLLSAAGIISRLYAGTYGEFNVAATSAHYLQIDCLERAIFEHV